MVHRARTLSPHLLIPNILIYVTYKEHVCITSGPNSIYHIQPNPQPSMKEVY